VEYIYADNVVEHLTLEQNRFLLAEAFRALQPGGRIRLVTPDVGALAALYMAGPEAAQALRDELIGEGYAVHHQVDVLRFAFQDDGHHQGYLWDEESLDIELTRVGFVGVNTHEAGSSGDPALCDLEVRVGSPVASICVIVEATKPN
jgi:predicted SAM-dependent methyltransferase